MNSGSDFHRDFRQQNHERQLTQQQIEANAQAAELIADRIAAKLNEQNQIIYSVGQKQGRTAAVAYISLIIGAVAAIGQLIGPISSWPIFN